MTLRPFIIASIFLLAANRANSETVRLAWNPPTERENGVKFSKEEVSYYLLSVNSSRPEEVTEDFTIKDLPLGDHSYVVVVCDLNGLCSNPKKKYFKVITKPKSPKYPSVSNVK